MTNNIWTTVAMASKAGSTKEGNPPAKTDDIKKCLEIGSKQLNKGNRMH